MYVEIFVFAVSSILIGFETFKMKSSLTTTKTKSLLIFLGFLNLSYLSRALGIYQNDLLFYTIWPAIFGVLGFIAFWYWGFLFVNKKALRNIGFSLISLGLISFTIGALTENDNLAGIAVIIFFAHFIVLVSQFYSYSRGTEYLLARLRIFSMTLAFIVYGFFETTAVLLMQFNIYVPAAIVFLFSLIGRIMLTLSISMPNPYQTWISSVKEKFDNLLNRSTSNDNQTLNRASLSNT